MFAYCRDFVSIATHCDAHRHETRVFAKDEFSSSDCDLLGRQYLLMREPGRLEAVADDEAFAFRNGVRLLVARTRSSVAAHFFARCRIRPVTG